MSKRFQNSHVSHSQVPSYYTNNNLYPGSYTRNDYPARTSRRIHDGLSINLNYGLDTTSDDVNSSPYSSPYYVNGRYNSDNLTTQRGNSASVQGIIRLISQEDTITDFTDNDVQTTIEMWQGKRIKFSMPYNGKIVGNTISIKNTEGCTGILSIYISDKDGGSPIYEASIDLKEISQDKFEHKKIYSITVVPENANPRGKVFVSMEIWNEVSEDRSANPFNTGRKIEIAATGLDNHYSASCQLSDKNTPALEKYDYERLPNRPCIAFVYNAWESVPTNRTEPAAGGAVVSLNGYRYAVFCCKNNTQAKVIIYDIEMNQIVSGTNIKIDGRVKSLNLVQAKDYVYYVDGYSPLQKFKVGEWTSISVSGASTDTATASVNVATFAASSLGSQSGTYVFTRKSGAWYYSGNVADLNTYGIAVSGTVAEAATITIDYTKASSLGEASATATYADTRPVIAASIISKANNRIYLAGFQYDPNLIQITAIDREGANFDSYPYRIYVPNQSPLETSTNPVTAIVEYESDTAMIAGDTFFSIFSTNVDIEDETPQQVSTYSDGGGVQSAGDICNYRGIIYSFDQDEGIRRFTGATWNKIPSTIDSYYERVDMSKPRKMYGYANKLYFNYTDKVDGKYKCLVWDMAMNYQQYPFFLDSDMPFCDVRYDDDYNLLGIHPDYPCIMKLYDHDCWRRFDSPIVFERHTKHISLPGNASDMILKRVHNKVIANSDRWWFFSLSPDKHDLTQYRDENLWYRLPCWDTLTKDTEFDDPFLDKDIYEEKATSVLTLPNLRIRAVSVQEKIRCKTFNSQANLISVLFEAQSRQYN